MASTYSSLKIELIGTGDQSGTWGTTTNNNLGDAALGEAITGSADVAFSSADVTVTLTDTNASQAARNLRLNLTGTTGGARSLILGSGCQIEKLYLINNTCADAITVKNTTGTGIAVAAGKSMFVYNNGTNVVEAVTQFNGTIALATGVSGVLPIANGGTGTSSTTFVDAATNITGTLPIANGGTGATTLRAATIATLGYTTTATAAGTTTLTATSTATQFFTGSTTQTVVLPVASTMTQGQQFTIHNNSSGALTINSSGANLVATVNANTTATITCILTSGTDAASWDADFTGFTTALPVARGGTGASTQTAYAVLAGGTTATGAYQSIASVGTTGQVLTSNGAGALPTFQAAAGGGGLLGYSVFTSNGTFTVPTGVTKLLVTCVGGGGGGGGSQSDDCGWAGGAGGGGGVGIKFITTTPSTAFTVTVGGGGTAGAAGTQSGSGAGGTSSFGTSVSATGGGGGFNSSRSQQNPTRGVGTSGDLNIYGSSAGFNYGNQSGMAYAPSVGINNSIAGLAYGGGASGANDGPATAGGVGGSGVVIVQY